MSRITIISLSLTVIAAITGYFGLMAIAPGYIMGRALEGITERVGGSNAIVHLPLTGAARRGIVRPSPDLVYSLCPYDLTEGNIKFTVPAIEGHYWSLTMFDDQTNAFFIENDQHTKGKPIELTLVKGEGAVDGRMVSSPSDTGIALIRILMKDRGEYDVLDALRRGANCEVLI